MIRRAHRLGQRDGEVGGHGRLADAAFAAGDRDDVLTVGINCCFHLAGGRPDARRHPDLHAGDARQGGDRALRLLLHLLAHGQAGVVSSMLEATEPSATRTSFTNPSATMSRPRSGVANDAQRVEISLEMSAAC